MGIVREPAVSGTFYPSNAVVLRQNVEGYLKNAAGSQIKSHITGIVVPHAGYMYSGQVAGYAYNTIAGARYDTVIVVAPSHRASFQGIAILEKGAYRTPLGDVSVDEEMATDLMKRNDTVKSSLEAHKYEHSLEVQIPFLQVALKGFKIIPLIMGSQSAVMCERLAASISRAAEATAKSILVVGSTDLSHYYPYKEAVNLDNVVIRHLESFDPQGMIRDFEKDRLEACGAGPMITTMMVARGLGASRSKVLNYATSGDVSGDKSSVVGYVSCVFYGESEA
jgi:AmmeMemoRadiSam system protein B